MTDTLDPVDTFPDLDLDLTVDPEPAQGSGAAVSLLGQIAARREERLADETLMLPVPTWGGDLVAKYEVVDVSRIAKLGNDESDELGIGANSDFLARSCVGLFVRDPERALVPLEHNGHQVAFTLELADLLGVTAEKARHVIWHVFKGNGVAIIQHADKVATWMQDTSARVDGQILGE